MNPHLVSILQLLHLYERGKAWRDTLNLAKRVMVCRWNRRKVLHRIRHRKKGEKIRVLFLVSEVAKWKCQTVFEAMKRSDVFEPLIGLTALSEQALYSDDEMEKTLEKNEAFFDRLGDAHVRAVKLHPRVYLDIRAFGADIVFFEEPWRMREPQTTETMSKHVLVCHVPYDVPDRIGGFCYREEVHRFISFYYTLNDSFCLQGKQGVSRLTHGAHFVPVGHPSLDHLARIPQPPPSDGFSIYAPHWYYPHPAHPGKWVARGTFLWSGPTILSYAQQHPEFHWLFKPHPKLKKELVTTETMSEDEVEAYYAAWEKVGTACYGGDYQPLFMKSRVMITDCATFLPEYFVTGNPIIQLKNEGCFYEPVIKGFYDIFYGAWNPAELLDVFSDVLEKGDDPLFQKRLALLESSGLGGGSAAKKIVEHLERICHLQ